MAPSIIETLMDIPAKGEPMRNPKVPGIMVKRAVTLTFPFVTRVLNSSETPAVLITFLSRKAP
jgi:hypothetical protein